MLIFKGIVEQNLIDPSLYPIQNRITNGEIVVFFIKIGNHE